MSVSSSSYLFERQAELATPPAHEVDDDIDSAIGEDSISETTSLNSTIMRHREEHGRTYHKFRGGVNDYWGPNDEQQNDQLDVGHHMLTILLDDQLYKAPIDPENCHRVLDVGTGTGIWAIDFADAHPNSEVIGVDLSPTQPSFMPPNCSFVVDDVTEEWTYPNEYFDFIHMRCLMGSISDWPALYKQVYDHLVPGGWFQHLDMTIEFLSDDGSVGPNHFLTEWSRTFVEAGELMGKTFRIADHSAQLIKETGFTNIYARRYKLPAGSWPKDKKMKEVGSCNYHYCQLGAEGWALFLLTRILGWEMPAVQVFIAKFRQALNNRKNHGYYSATLVYAQKPYTENTA